MNLQANARLDIYTTKKQADAKLRLMYAIQEKSIAMMMDWFAATVKVPAMATNAITPFVIPLSNAKTDRDALPAVV